MPFSAIDHAHMALALRLAERGAYTTRPNPMVGCVLARDGEVVYHRAAGLAENLDLFDFALTEDEMAAIATLDAGERTGPDPAVFS